MSMTTEKVLVRTIDSDGVREKTIWDAQTSKLITSVSEFEPGRGLGGLKTQTTIVLPNGDHVDVKVYGDGFCETKLTSAADIQRALSLPLEDLPKHRPTDREMAGCMARSFRPGYPR